MLTVERMYVEVCWESRDAATTTRGRQVFSAVCSFHAFMFSWRVKYAFSSKRKAALGGFGVRIQTNSPRSSFYSWQTGVVWPSRSFVFDFQSDIRLTQVSMHTFTNNPKIIMTITKKVQLNRDSSYAPNGWKSTIHWHLHKKGKHDTRTWFDFRVDSAEQQRGCGRATLRVLWLLFWLSLVYHSALSLAARLRIRGSRLSFVGKAAKTFKQTVLYKMRLCKCQAFGGRVGGGNSPSCSEQHTCTENKTEIYQTVKMTSDFDLTLPEKVIWSLTWCCVLRKWSKLDSFLHRPTNVFPQTQVRPFMPHLPSTICLLQHPHSAPSLINFLLFPSIHPSLPHLHSPLL